MNQAYADPHSQQPKLRNTGTGQYTISVSKPGTGEDPEPVDNQLNLIIKFQALEEGLFVPNACRVDVRRDGTPQGIDKSADFEPHNGAYVAKVDMTLEEDWQATAWVDLYLVQGDEQIYALSAYLSTLLADLMTITCTYHSDPPRHGQGE